MQLLCETARFNAMRALAQPARCPYCGDWMVAPVMSEFVNGSKIRHHWECESCGESSCTSIEFDPE